ncbi:MAG: LytR C-terminal domain-containing protein [Candidatus Moranbacteria bacterium]|nr:LytR C-terminal domain-containing protein [Candidatus Moranbacteria bacterium]
MFFRHHITTIFVTRGKITSAVFSTGGKNIKAAAVYDWNEENLALVLADIAAHGPNVVRVVFGEEFSYVTTLDSSKGDRGSILEKAREAIPEELGDNWDFRKEKDQLFSSQVIAVQAQLLNMFIEKLKEAGLRVEAMEPQSVAIARLLPKTGLFLFAVNDEKFLMGAVRNGTVIGTFVAAKSDDASMLAGFVASVRKKCKEELSTVLIDKYMQVGDDVFLANGLQPEIMELDPLYSIAVKKHLVGSDSHVLNILPVDKKILKKQATEKYLSKIENTATVQAPARFSLREKILAIFFVIGLVASGFVLLKKMPPKKQSISLIATEKKQEVAMQNDVIQNPSATVEQQASAEKVVQDVVSTKRPQDLQILILNGGAAVGSAAKVKDILVAKKYVNIDAQNAENKDNVGVVLYYQAQNVENMAQIKADLQKTYPKIVAKEASSAEEKSSEIVIILGK